jgi:hypothetical protein
MKSKLPSFIKRNAVVVFFTIVAVAALFMLGFLRAPSPRTQWGGGITISTPTPTATLVGNGWWNNISTPKP